MLDNILIIALILAPKMLNICQHLGESLSLNLSASSTVIVQMLSHHSITGAITEALGYCSRHHPDNPKSEEEKRQEKQDEQNMADELHDIRVDGADTGATLDLLSRSSQSSE